MAPKSQKPKPFDVKQTAEERDALADELCTAIQDAFDARASIIATDGLIDLADWYYEQGRSQAKERPFPGAADLTSFLITQDVDSLRARLAKAVFGVRPLAFVEGFGPSAQRAGYVEEFVDWQVRRGPFKRKIIKCIHGALLEDCYVLEVSEKVETTRRTEQLDAALDTHPETGGPIFDLVDGKQQPRLKMDEAGDPVPAQQGEAAAKIERTYTKTKRLGPQYTLISMKDFVFLPGHAKDTEDVWGYAYKFSKRVPELEEAAQDGIYDAEAVQFLGDNSDTQSENTSPAVDTVASQRGPAVEKELYQLSLKRDLDGDGREEWYLATVSVKYRKLLRLKLDTFVQKVGRPRCVPLVLYPRRNSVYGYSFAFNKLLTLADEHTSLRNMKADRSALATNKPIKQLQGGMWDADAQPFGVGAVITVRDHNEVQEFEISDVPNSVVEQERSILESNERVSGLADQAVVGITSEAKRTATEQRFVAGGSGVRVDEVVGHLHAFLADVLTLTLEIWRETLQADPKGVEAPPSVLNALQFRGMDFGGKFTYDMLQGDFQFEPYGSDDTADPMRRRQDTDASFIALANLGKVFPGIQMLFQNPETTKAVVEQWARAYNVRDRQPFLQPLMAHQPMGAPPVAGPGMAPPAEEPGADFGSLMSAIHGAGAGATATGDLGGY